MEIRDLKVGDHFKFPNSNVVCRLDQVDQPSRWPADPQRYWRWTNQFGHWDGSPGDAEVEPCEEVEFVNHYDQPCDRKMPTS